MVTLYYFSVLLAVLSVFLITLTPVTGYLSVMLFKPVIDTGFYVFFGPGITLTKLYGVIIPIIIFFYMFFSVKPGLRISSMPMKGIWLVYSIYVVFFSGLIIYKEGVVSGTDVLFSHINGIVGFYMMQAFIRNDADMRKFILILILAGLFPVFTTLYQVITGYQWHILENIQSQHFTRNPGLYYLINTIRYYSFQTIVAMLLYSTYVRKPVMWEKYLAWIYAAIIFVVIFFTYSKAAYLATMAGLLVWLVLNKKYIVVAIMGGVVVLAIPFYVSEIVDVFYTVFQHEIEVAAGDEGGRSAFGGRLGLWSFQLDKLSDQSFFAQLFGSGQNMKGAHNDYLMMLWHGGYIGLLIYVVLLCSIGFKLLIEVKRKVDPLIVVSVMLYIAYLIDTIGLVPSAYPHFQWLVWGFVGLAFRERRQTLFGVTSTPEMVDKVVEQKDTRILSRKK